MSGCHPDEISESVSPVIKQIQFLEKRLCAVEDALLQRIDNVHQILENTQQIFEEKEKLLKKRINELESRCVTAEVLFTMRQTIETWQRGCEIRINSLSKNVAEDERRISAIVQSIKQDKESKTKWCPKCKPLNGMIGDDCICSMLPSIGELNKIAFNTLDKLTAKQILDLENNPVKLSGKILVTNQADPTMNGIYVRDKSEEEKQEGVNAAFWFNEADKFKGKLIHLEKCLEHKNKLLRSMEDELARAKNDLTGAMINDRESRSENTKLRRQVESLLDQVKHLESNQTKLTELASNADYHRENYIAGKAGRTPPPDKCCKDFPHVGNCL